jgi:hypothetical protein
LVCDGKASNRGGLLFRCTDCPSTVCESCLPESFEAVDRNEVVAVLGFLSGSIEYIRCSACLTKPPNALYRLLHGNACTSKQGPTSSSQSVEAGSGGKLSFTRHSDSKKTVIVSSDDDLDTPVILLKSKLKEKSKVQDQQCHPQNIDSEGASGPAELGKRRLETESTPIKGRPARHCAIVGADARFARQLQETRMHGEGAVAGVQSRSPRHPRIPQDGEGQRLPGMDDIASQELAWSSAQTPTTEKPPSQFRAGEICEQSASLHFPSILSGNGTVDDQIEISSD